MKKNIFYVAVIAALCASFLFSPAPVDDNDYCGRYYKLNNLTGFTVNCDALGYVYLAEHPSLLLVQDEVRQSRPLYVLLGSAVGHTVYLLFYPVQLFSPDDWDAHKLKSGCLYAGYVLLNFFILLAALFLFLEIAGSLAGNGSAQLACILSLFLASNEIIKAFFWTAHLQLFSLLTPLISVYVSQYVWKATPSKNKLMLLSFAFGIGMLIYGNFLPAFACLYLLHSWQLLKGMYANNILSAIGFEALLLCVFIFPTSAWILLLHLSGVTYYNHEIEAYQQLVWMLQADAASLFLQYLKTFALHLQNILVFLIPAGCALFFSLLLKKAQESSSLFLLVFNLLVFVVFFALLGFYTPRLNYNFFPLLLLLLYIGLQHIRVQKLAVATTAIAFIAWHLYELFSYGPFS